MTKEQIFSAGEIDRFGAAKETYPPQKKKGKMNEDFAQNCAAFHIKELKKTHKLLFQTH